MFVDEWYFGGSGGRAVLKAALKVASCVLTLLGCSAEQSDPSSDPLGTGSNVPVGSTDPTTDGNTPNGGGGSTAGVPTGAGGSVAPPSGMAGNGAANSAGAAGLGGDAAGGAGADGAGGAGADAAGGSGGNAGTAATAGGADAGGSAGTNAGGGSAGTAAGGAAGMEAVAGAGGDDVVDTGAADNFSFFVTSYEQLIELAGTEDGFGGDLRYNGAATGLEGADAICQELARRVGFGQRTWKAYLSTSTVNAIDRIGAGPWYDFTGTLVADDPSGLTSGDRPAGGCCDEGTYDELGTFHDGTVVDDHDTLTATLSDGTYAGFSCDDWTSVTAEGESGGGFGSGPIAGHMWPAQSGQNWAEAHGVPGCGAGTILQQGGGFGGTTVGALGGYGALYCFALAE